MKVNFKIIGLILFIGIASSITVYRNLKKNDLVKTSIIETPVRLAVGKAFITAPLLLALKLDYFREEGLNVQVVGEYSSGKESLEKMLSGGADISTPATTPVVFNSFKRKDFSIFLTYLTSYDGIKIIARKDHNIFSAQDLKNKKIGIVPGTISQILIDTFLAYNKILTSEVILKNYKGSELAEALNKGEVDAISMWEPYAYYAQKKLQHLAHKIPTSKVYRISINLAVMNKYAAENPVVLKKFIKALQHAVDFIKKEKTEAQILISEILEMDINLVEEFWRDVKFTTTLDQLLIITMENESRWAMEHKIISTPIVPNYLEFINTSFLEQIEPSAVTLIKGAK